MKSGGPSFRPRMSGGFNQGVGDLNEHLDENAMHQAAGQKALGQQQADPGQLPAAAQPDLSKPRSVSPRDELKWFGQDVVKGLRSIFNLESALSIDPVADSPQDQANKKQFHQRYSQLSQDEQEYAQQLYRQKMEQKKQAEEAEAKRKLEQQEQDRAQVIVPSSPRKGPVGPGMSRKQQAAAQLQHNRQVLGAPSGSN